MKFQALADFPVFKLREGDLIEVSEQDFENNKGYEIFKDRRFFKEWIAPEDMIREKDQVVVWGYWKNLTHPGHPINHHKNIAPVRATIDVAFETQPGMYTITVIANNGERLQVITPTIKKKDLGNGIKPNDCGHMCYISYAHAYWFVNSDGVVCSDVIGRNQNRERWLKKSGNYWPTSDIANQYRDHILYGKVFDS